LLEHLDPEGIIWGTYLTEREREELKASKE